MSVFIYVFPRICPFQYIRQTACHWKPQFWFVGLNWLNSNPFFFFSGHLSTSYKWTWKLLFWFYDWNFDEDIQSFSAWLACAASLMTVTAAKFNQKPLCLSLQENDDLFQQLTSNKVVPRVLGLDLRALFVGSATQSRRTELTDKIKKQIQQIRFKCWETLLSIVVTDSIQVVW